MDEKKYAVGFQLTFDKVQADGSKKRGMTATIQYEDMTYADAVKAEACAQPMLAALFALGAEQAQQG